MKEIAVFVCTIICITCKGITTLTGDMSPFIDVKNLPYIVSDTISFTDKNSFSLILNSLCRNDTIKVIDYKEDPYASPVTLCGEIVSMSINFDNGQFDYQTTAEYADNAGNHILGLPTRITVIGHYV